MNIQDIVPDEILFLSATLDVSFITDRYNAFYHDRQIKSCIQRDHLLIPTEFEEDAKGFTDEEIQKLKAPGSAYWRMYWESGFEKLLALTCLDKEDAEYLMDITSNLQGRFKIPYSLAHTFMGFPDELKSEDICRIEKVCKDAVIAWDYTSGNPDGMYDLLDEKPDDERIYREMRKWMEESGCQDLVKRASREGRSIWDLMRERPTEDNVLWVAMDVSEDDREE